MAAHDNAIQNEPDTSSLTGAELVNPYDDRRAKSGQVRQMFDSIAPAYDIMNTAMTFGLHRFWRNRALSAALKNVGQSGPVNILDIATGTGDVAFELHRRLPSAHIFGIDLSEGMLEIARKKLEKLDESANNTISFEQGDSLSLRFPDDAFDLITVAYGVRNFEHLEKGLTEMARVLKPEGTLCVVELSEPASLLARSLYRAYSRGVIPFVGRLVSGDSRAYSYLPESIAAAPQRDDMAEVMLRAGLGSCIWKSLTFGAVTYYICRKPVAATRSVQLENYE